MIDGSNQLHKTISGHLYHVWALRRPLTRHWGSGAVYERICKSLGVPDIVFGKQDQIPDGVLAIDLNTGYNWLRLPFEDNQFEFGYWDPPYDRMYAKEAREIWRTVRRLAILHTHIYPTSWLRGGKRIATIAVTFGPKKQIRCLQVFDKTSLSQIEMELT